MFIVYWYVIEVIAQQMVYKVARELYKLMRIMEGSQYHNESSNDDVVEHSEEIVISDKVLRLFLQIWIWLGKNLEMMSG